MRALIFVIAAAAALPRGDTTTQHQNQSLEDVVARMSRYVAGYGEQASLIVAVEKYEQQASGSGGRMWKPRKLTAEFVIVRVEGAVGWWGFRDIIEVDGSKLTDRSDRLAHLFTASSFDGAAVMQIANESARYNIGPTIRNFNVPTTALFFFHPASVSRFSFTKKGTKRFGPIEAWEIAFTETKRPTLIMKRDGTDVPCTGTVWVSPDDGTILRTRLELKHFADARVAANVGVAQGPPAAPPVNPTPPAPGTVSPSPPPPPTARAKQLSQEVVTLESLAAIDVTYERDQRLGLWLPSKMTEFYELPMARVVGAPPALGRTTTEARYSDFRQFQTATKISFPK